MREYGRRSLLSCAAWRKLPICMRMVVALGMEIRRARSSSRASVTSGRFPRSSCKCPSVCCPCYQRGRVGALVCMLYIAAASPSYSVRYVYRSTGCGSMSTWMAAASAVPRGTKATLNASRDSALTNQWGTPHQSGESKRDRAAALVGRLPCARRHVKRTCCAYAEMRLNASTINVLRRDGGLCAYCGDKAASVDHIIPVSRYVYRALARAPSHTR
jgi:hypothetical protein